MASEEGIRKVGDKWAAYIKHDGRQYQKSVDGGKRAARKLRRQWEKEIADGTFVPPKRRKRLKVLTVATWITAWLDKRASMRNPPKSLRKERQRLRDYVVPLLGDHRLEDLDVVDIEAWLQDLASTPSKRTGEPLSRNTLFNVFQAFDKCLRDGEKHLSRQRGAHWRSPIRDLDSRERPQKVSKPRDYWRRDDARALIVDPELPDYRRVLWAVLFYLGVRIDEAAALTLEDIDRTIDPLPMVTVSKQVGGKPLKEDRANIGLRRLIPLHPELDRILGEWLGVGGGFQRLYGRAAKPSDYIVPNPWDVADYWKQETARKWIKRDCRTVGAKVLTTHCARSTFSTLMTEDAPELEHIVRTMTHSQKIGGGAHGYIRTRYLAKCQAMMAYDLKLREHGEVVSLPVAVGQSADCSADKASGGAVRPTKIGGSGGEGGIRTPGTAFDRTTA